MTAGYMTWNFFADCFGASIIEYCAIRGTHALSDGYIQISAYYTLTVRGLTVKY